MQPICMCSALFFKFVHATLVREKALVKKRELLKAS